MRTTRFLAKRIFVICALVCISGCASVPLATPEHDQKAKQFVTENSKASIYIYRHEVFGSAIKMPVLIDSVYAGTTVSKTFIFKQVEPGIRTIISKSETDAPLTFEAQPGKKYFIWQEVKMGILTARSQLHMVDENKAKAEIADCKLIQ